MLLSADVALLLKLLESPCSVLLPIFVADLHIAIPWECFPSDSWSAESLGPNSVVEDFVFVPPDDVLISEGDRGAAFSSSIADKFENDRTSGPNFDMENCKLSEVAFLPDEAELKLTVRRVQL